MYRLRHRATGLSYENFELDDVRDDDTIQVNFELYDQMLFALDEHRTERRKAARRRGLAERTNSLSSASSRGSSFFRVLTDIPKLVTSGSLTERSRSIRINPERYKRLSFRQKVWVFLDVPSSGYGAAAFALFMLALIVYSTVTFCAATLHGQYDFERSESSFYNVSEAVCIVIFTLEVWARMWSTPDLKRYLTKPMNLLDIVAVLPFYVELCMTAARSDDEVPGMSVIRVLRLVRVLRLLRASRASVDIFAETMSKSLRPLNMLLALVVIALVVCGSLIFLIERGRWNADMMYWERPIAYDCAVRVVAEAGEPNLGSEPTFFAGYGDECERESVATDERSAVFTCRFPFERGDDCVTVYAQSPFDSIVASFWWSWVTMSTVGYGDVTPRTVFGKAFGMLVMFLGILVIALPVTVIGANFSTVYNKVQLAEEERKSMRVDSRRRLSGGSARRLSEGSARRLSEGSGPSRQSSWGDDKSSSPRSGSGPRRLSLRSPRTGDRSIPSSP